MAPARWGRPENDDTVSLGPDEDVSISAWLSFSLPEGVCRCILASDEIGGSEGEDLGD